MYVAVEPSNVPPGVSTVASLTASGDPQSPDGRSHEFKYRAHSTKTTHTAIGNLLCVEVNYYQCFPQHNNRKALHLDRKS